MKILTAEIVALVDSVRDVISEAERVEVLHLVEQNENGDALRSPA